MRFTGDDGDLPRRIDRDAAPVRAADIRRHHQRALRAGRREDALVAKRLDRRAARGAIGVGDAPDLIDREPMWTERRRARA